MKYAIMNEIADRCQHDIDRPCRITAIYLILGTGDHTHAYYFNSERERLAFEEQNPQLEIWEFFYEKALYLFPPVVTFRTAEEVRERELWQAVLHAKRGEEFHAAMRAYNKAKRPSWRQEIRDKHN